jgi:aryl-alcohol dehydrogenase-like predicted oxidoreductase
LLKRLKRIADKHAVSIANVATRYILDKPRVAGVIIGTRLGLSDHREDNTRAFGFQLDAQDLEQIENVLVRSRDLYRVIGDCGDEYRSR